MHSATITITIVNPKHGVSLLRCSWAQLQRFPSMKIFPDNKGPADSSFPLEGVSIVSKPQGHMVIAYGHLEKWVLSGFVCETVDLGLFSEHWKGCRVMLMTDNNDFADDHDASNSTVANGWILWFVLVCWFITMMIIIITPSSRERMMMIPSLLRIELKAWNSTRLQLGRWWRRWL